MAITSSYTLGPVQADGKTPVIETHVSDLFPERVVRKEYSAYIDPQHPEYVNPETVMQLRKSMLSAEEAASGRAILLAATGSFGLNKYEFRKLFTEAETDAIDEFNEGGYLTNVLLTDEQKSTVRRSLAHYAATPFIELDNPDVITAINLYVALGFLTQERAMVILNG